MSTGASYYSYYLGLDLGQARDFTALTIIEKQVWNPDTRQWVSPASMSPQRLPHYAYARQQPDTEAPLHVRHLHRYPLGTSYPDIVRDVGRILQSGGMNERGQALVIDATGVGRPVTDLFKEAGLRPIPVTITGGDKAHRDGHRGAWTVPKRELVSALQVSLQTGRLKVAQELEYAETLVRELLNFRVEINLKSGHDSYEAWREGVHDDLVLSSALAVWYAQRIEPSRRLVTF